jgi:glycosyltransferase involved in cell wall biosynthesis
MTPKRVLRISNRFNVGGPTLNVAYLSKFLPEDFETTLVAGNIEPHEGSSTYILDDLKLKYSIVPSMFRNIHLKNDLNALKYLVSLTSSLKPDIVHTHAAKAGALGRLATILSSHKVPVVVHTYHGNVFDGYFSPLKERVFLGIERFLARKSSAIIAISNSQKYDLVYKYKIAQENKVQVIPLGFDLDRMNINVQAKRVQLRNEFSLNDDVVVVSIIGRLTAIKNHELFLRVFKKSLEQSSKSIKAFIVGDGEERKNLQKLCDSLGLSWSSPDVAKTDVDVYFTSWRKDIDVVNAGSDIIMLTSKNEGTPVSIIEAMAAGKAVISTDVGGVRDIIRHGESGMIAENDKDSIVSSLVTLIDNRQLREDLGRQAQPDVIKKFGYKRLVSEVSDLYRKLLNENKADK